jgi:hypothetical protein
MCLKKHTSVKVLCRRNEAITVLSSSGMPGKQLLTDQSGLKGKLKKRIFPPEVQEQYRNSVANASPSSFLHAIG